MNLDKSVVNGTGCPSWKYCAIDCVICGVVITHDINAWLQHKEKIRTLIVERRPRLHANSVDWWVAYIMVNCSLSNFLEVIESIEYSQDLI